MRVLAINSKVGEPGSVGSAPAEQRGHTFSGQAIATLALAPGDADLVVSALAIGKLSLLLRPIDASDTDKTAKTAGQRQSGDPHVEPVLAEMMRATRYRPMQVGAR